MPATMGMKGAGYYDRHSGAQLSAIQALQDWVDDAVANLPLPDADQPVTVLDLGSSEGHNAIRMMAAIVAGLRRRTDQPLQAIYNDLASNNFNQLFANLQEARRAATLLRRFTPAPWGVRFTARCCRPAQSISPPASTPPAGSTGCQRSP